MTDLVQFRLLVSIVNYRSSSLVCELLPGLIEQLNKETDHVVVVDNASPDDSCKVLENFIKSNHYSDKVTLTSSSVNGGFSYGNNLAIKTANIKFNSSPEFVLLLNPDTKLRNGAIEALLAFAEQNARVGIVGSRLESESGVPQVSAFKFPGLVSEFLSSISLGFLSNLLSKWQVADKNIPEQATRYDWVAGASMLVRYDVFKNIGLMDENYFLYYEETDFCLQAARNGWECWFLPKSRVIHFVGQSTGIVSHDSGKKRRPKYWFESRQYYFRKNYGIAYTILIDFIWGTGFALLKLRYFLQGKKGNDPVHMLKDFWRNSIFLSWKK